MAAKNSLQTLDKPVLTKARHWADVPDEKWLDWRWQMSNRLDNFDELDAVIQLTKSEKTALKSKG